MAAADAGALLRNIVTLPNGAGLEVEKPSLKHGLSNIFLPPLENTLAAILRSAFSLGRLDPDSSIAVEVTCGASVVVISLRRIFCNHHTLVVV